MRLMTTLLSTKLQFLFESLSSALHRTQHVFLTWSQMLNVSGNLKFGQQEHFQTTL